VVVTETVVVVAGGAAVVVVVVVGVVASAATVVAGGEVGVGAAVLAVHRRGAGPLWQAAQLSISRRQRTGGQNVALAKEHTQNNPPHREGRTGPRPVRGGASPEPADTVSLHAPHGTLMVWTPSGPGVLRLSPTG
jgi:hypothetical protein